jgi:hypothetical protein
MKAMNVTIIMQDTTMLLDTKHSISMEGITVKDIIAGIANCITTMVGMAMPFLIITGTAGI